MKQTTVPVERLKNRYARYNSTSAGKARRRAYRHNNSKWETDAHYLSRPVVAFDGEGVTGDDGIHRYTTLAAMSSETMEYVAVTDPGGIPTEDCFDFIIEQANNTPNAISIIYGGSYDFNMFLNDFTERAARQIYERDFYRWRGYKLGWRRGKTFYAKNLHTGDKVTVYDVVSFFQTSFVRACDSYLGTDWENRDGIIESKARRGTFTDDDDITDYNRSELVNLIRLFQELRKRLNKAGLRPARWDGPGAVAAALLKREKVKECMAVSPHPVARAARYAYAGGRFEVIMFGHSLSPAWEYDINSAYPAALRTVPDLTDGKWIHSGFGIVPEAEFSLVRIRSEAYRRELPAPLFARLKNGSIGYPMNVEGWYWKPEYDATVAYQKAGYGQHVILESWQFIPNAGARKPFAFIDSLYKKRQALKAADDGAHVGIKLGLNSLYGKLAQQVGARLRDDGTWRTPPFHQIEWAGYTTSWCRAKVLMAALQNLESVIAFETDALFTSAPLDVPISEELGDFGPIEFTDLTYVQSGIYFGNKTNGKVAKSRGVDLGRLDRATVLGRFRQLVAADREVTVKLSRFVTIGLALMQSFERWRKWETVTKTIGLEPETKRIHVPLCNNCRPGRMELDAWHYTLCPYMGLIKSAEYPVIWCNPDPNMDKLDEFRNREQEWE